MSATSNNLTQMLDLYIQVVFALYSGVGPQKWLQTEIVQNNLNNKWGKLWLLHDL